MAKRSRNLRHYLQPFSWLYGIGVGLRNLLFDYNILKQEEFEVPVICVGNITVGGTGKTPHIEYLIRLLSDQYKVGVLSRGYKRKSKGYHEVLVDSTARQVGDEPLQIKKKYPDALVVVDSNRRRGIYQMLSYDEGKRPDVILLDDGYQHRYVKPSLSVLLVDSNRPIYEDRLLPAGNLREPIKAKNRAAIVLVTKCKSDMKPIEKRMFKQNLNLFVYQQLHFTTFGYGVPQPVFADVDAQPLAMSDLRNKNIYLVTGIARPQPLEKELRKLSQQMHTNYYPDHYFFKKSDIKKITNDYQEMSEGSNGKVLITTEKDAVRLRAFTEISEDVKRRMYYIPIEVTFLKKQSKDSFNYKIINHVRNY